ncbi:MAG: hypothetical protein U0871_03880 [Gemmataceae bacterium]
MRTDIPADVSWRVFRLVTVGSALSCVACFAGLVWLTYSGVLSADDAPWSTRMAVLIPALFGTFPMANYPWERRREGSRAVRVAVLVVGVPSAGILLLILTELM